MTFRHLSAYLSAMQPHTPRPEGKPALPAASLVSRVPGMVRPSVDLPVAMVAALDRLAAEQPTGAIPRAGMIRVLLGEALAARGVDWTGAKSLSNSVVTKKAKGARK